MTTVAVLTEPPRPGHVLSRLVEESPLTPAEGADLYAAMLRDVARAVERSGGDLLVNYRADSGHGSGAETDAGSGAETDAGSTAETDAGSAAEAEDGSAAETDAGSAAEAEVRSAVHPALEEPDEARFEVQVGETFWARAGNTVTHLLESEDVNSVAVVEPTAPFLGRTEIDGAAMKLRRSEVVLGPAHGGRVYYAGFTDTIDFDVDVGTGDPGPAIERLAARARDAGHDVDFLEMLPVVEEYEDFASALSLLAARRTAGLPVPEHFAATCEEFGLDVEIADGRQHVRR